jgi:hypothetical protein
VRRSDDDDDDDDNGTPSDLSGRAGERRDGKTWRRGGLRMRIPRATGAEG